VTSRAWRWYVILACAVITAYLFAPSTGWWAPACAMGSGYLGAIAIMIGVRRQPPRVAVPWWILAFAVASSSSGGIAIQLGVGEVTGPDLSDYLYLAFYPLCAITLGIMIKQLQRRMDWAAVIDALTVTTGIGLLDWVYSIQPALHAQRYAFADRITIVAYPICDLVLLAMTIILVRSNGRGGLAPRLIAYAIAGYLIGDWAWVLVSKLHPAWYDNQWANRGIDCAYLVALALMGLAAARPRIEDQGPGAAALARLGILQLSVLTVAVLIAPALLVIEVVQHRVHNGLSIAAGAATMFLLVVTRMGQLLRQAEHTSRQVRELSRRDELTGLANRRAWVDELPRVLEEARRDGLPVSIGMLDLDHFKSYNDRFGHPAGDRLLKEASAAWHGALRRTDILARYGGEEFIVLLPGADLEQATATLERLRAATPPVTTFSAGVAAWDGTETSEDLIARADAALYAAKGAGRNRVIAVLAA
jgi:diguanylate cyclase (GGDEF)-like protein